MEPIARRQFPTLMGAEFDATQTIIVCGDYALSVINAKIGSHWHGGDDDLGHGWYTDGPDSYEVALITLNRDEPFRFSLISCTEDNQYIDVKGYLSIEDVGELCEALATDGIEGYTTFRC